MLGVDSWEWRRLVEVAWRRVRLWRLWLVYGSITHCSTARWSSGRMFTEQVGEISRATQSRTPPIRLPPASSTSTFRWLSPGHQTLASSTDWESPSTRQVRSRDLSHNAVVFFRIVSVEPELSESINQSINQSLFQAHMAHRKKNGRNYTTTVATTYLYYLSLKSMKCSQQCSRKRNNVRTYCTSYSTSRLSTQRD